MATTKTLLPAPYLTLEDIDGHAIAGGTVTFKVTGTAVLAVVYADADGLVISPNPVTVDAAGRYSVWLTPGDVVDIEYRDALGTLLKTVPGVMAMPGASGNVDTTGVLGDAAALGQLLYLSDGAGGKTAGRWWLASGNQAASISTLGMPLAAGAAGATISIRTAGTVTGLTGLLVGARYYVSTTVAGALSLTVTENYRVVGQADTTTSLVLAPNPLDPRVYVDNILSPAGVFPQFTFMFTASTVRFNVGSTPTTVQGIKAGYHGQRVRLVAVGSSVPINFAHNHAGAAAGDRLFNWVTSAPTSIVTGGVIEYEYDTLVPGWRLVAHEQGGWITPAFNAADYTATGGTWTVVVGNVNRCAYYLHGRVLRVQLWVSGSAVTGVTGQLQRAIPGGFNSSVGSGPMPAVALDNAVPVTTGASYIISGSTIFFQKDMAAINNWTQPATNTWVGLDASIEVS